MRARIEFDENNYIKHFVTDWMDGNYEVDDGFEFEYMTCYHLVDGQIVLDEVKKQEQITQYNNEEEIIRLETLLDDSDYIVARCFEEIMALDNKLTFIADFIGIVAKYATQYKDAIAQRKQWRARIEELKGN